MELNWDQALLGSGLVTWKCTFLAFCPYDIHLDKA